MYENKKSISNIQNADNNINSWCLLSTEATAH